jgi:hypothetical protein
MVSGANAGTKCLITGMDTRARCGRGTYNTLTGAEADAIVATCHAPMVWFALV